MDVSMSNPFRKESPHLPPTQPERRELRRLGLLALLLLALVLGMMALFLVQKDSKKEKDRRPARAPESKDLLSHPPATKKAPPPAQDREAKAKATLETLRDGRDPIRKDQPEFLDFLYLMQGLDAKTVSGRVRPQVAPPSLLKDPAKHRGEYVRLRGRMVQIYTEPMIVTTVTDTRDVYLGFMEAWPSRVMVAFYLPERPTNAETGKPLEFHVRRVEGRDILEDWVEIEGMFLRVYEYEGDPYPDKRPRWIRAPLVFAKIIRPVSPPKDRGTERTTKSFAIVVLGVAGGIALLVLLGGFMARKHSAGSMRMRMLAVKREKARKEGKEFLPTAKRREEVLGDEVRPPDPER